MKKRTYPILAFAILSLLLFVQACNQKTTKQQEENQTLVDTIDTIEAITTINGQEIYETKCITCHGEDGKGFPGEIPPLAESDYLKSDKVRAAIQTLRGSHKEMIVNGIKYNGEMPPQLKTEEEAVAVINYVLNNFGNDGGTIYLDDVIYQMQQEEEVDDIPFDTEKVVDALGNEE